MGRRRRLLAADEVQTAGWGGLKIVSEVTGLAHATSNRGEDDAEPPDDGVLRRAGGGRRPVATTDPKVTPELRRLVEPATA
jgi:hypothetical protein